ANHVGVVFAERILGLERDGDRFADLLEVERVLDLREDARMPAMEVGDRLGRFLEPRVARVEQLEGDREDGVGGDVHRGGGRGAYVVGVARHCTARLRPASMNRLGTMRLLGGRDPAAFLARFWQKRALFVPDAVSGFEGIASYAQLATLAQRDDVESRLVMRQ